MRKFVAPMSRILNSFFRWVGGVDGATIDTCPNYDRIWATHIGVALTFTFVIIFCISYLSFDYVNASSVVYNAEAGTFELLTNKKSPATIGVGLVIASVIASIVFLFDRAIYQSDWFYQLPFMAQHSWADRIFNILSRVGRISVRLAISVALAYALSIFLELRIYESQILSEMQRGHLTENAQHYTKLRDEIGRIGEGIEKSRETLHNLQDNLSKAIDLRDKEPSQIRQDIESRIATLTDKKNNEMIGVENRYADALQKGNFAIGGVQTDIADKEAKVRDWLKKANAEEAGNPEGIDGVSGIPTCDRRCIYYKNEAALENERIATRRADLDAANAHLAVVQKAIDTEKATLAEKWDLQIGTLMRDREALPLTWSQEFRAEMDRRIQLLRTEVQDQEEVLSKAISSKDNAIALAFKRLAVNPEFIQFRDGPLDRLRVLLDLKGNSRYGATVVFFSFWLKAFVIFLEVVPVVAKMLFAPPSAYAIKLQAQAYEASNEAYRAIRAKGIDAEILMEKKRIELNEIRKDRSFSDDDLRAHQAAFAERRMQSGQT